MNPLTQLFIETDFDDAQFIEQHYEAFSISFFDHVLTEEEYIKTSLGCFARAGYDLTHQIFIAKQFAQPSEQVAQKIKVMTVAAGLHLL